MPNKAPFFITFSNLLTIRTFFAIKKHKEKLQNTTLKKIIQKDVHNVLTNQNWNIEKATYRKSVLKVQLSVNGLKTTVG